MLGLIEGYFLIFIALIGANIALYLGDFKVNNFKAIVTSIIISLMFLAFNMIQSNTADALQMDSNLGWILFFAGIALLTFAIIYIKTRNIAVPFAGSILILYSITVSLSSINEPDLVYSLLMALFLLVIMIAIFFISKLLHYAKRKYYLIVGEYSSLAAIFTLICGLTYWSCRDLDYSMFSAYLILTPTYQLIYVIIGIVVVIIIGLYYSDKQMKKRL